MKTRLELLKKTHRNTYGDTHQMDFDSYVRFNYEGYVEICQWCDALPMTLPEFISAMPGGPEPKHSYEYTEIGTLGYADTYRIQVSANGEKTKFLNVSVEKMAKIRALLDE